MSAQTSLLATLSAISSPASVSGPTPCDSPGGPTIGPSGQDPAHASLSVQQAKAQGLLTSGTYGPPSTGLSVSVALTRSLASRLQVATGELGSTLYRLTWREKATPSGRCLPWLVASVPPTSGSGCTGLAAWPTCTANDSRSSRNETANRSKPSTRNPGMTLTEASELAAWSTPTTRDHKDGASDGTAPTNGLLGRQVWEAKGAARLTVTGKTLTGSDAGMGSGGQLSPAHSRWLIGLPAEWDSCGGTAMQSSRSKRRRS